MEGRARHRTKLSRRDLILTAWRRLGRPRVGKRELGQIQKAIVEQFGESAQSPASLARVLVDEGAELRHPEVIEFDAHWRGSQIESEAEKFKGLERFFRHEPITLKQIESLVKKMERLRQRFERSSDRDALHQLKTLAGDARRAAQSAAKDEARRTEQLEIVEWLTVWIQTPSLFEDWIELRRRAPEFRKRFATKKDR